MKRKDNLHEDHSKKIQQILNNYRRCKMVDLIKNKEISISESLLFNSSILSQDSQLPDLVIKSKIPFDKNYIFVRKTFHKKNFSPNVVKMIIKDYTANFFPKVPFTVPSELNEINDNYLSVIRQGFEFLGNSQNIPQKCKFETKYSFLNIDLELQLNYEMLNENKKWLLVVPEDGDIYGPLGTSHVYLFLQTKNKNLRYKNQTVYVVDLDNECYMSYHFSQAVLADEIKSIIENSERDGVKFMNFNYWNKRNLVEDKNNKFNKFDLR